MNIHPPAPECSYCGETGVELRQIHAGMWHVPPDLTCEACFWPSDDGPCFDDLPLVSERFQMEEA
jgi:uncharacterized OB-fold protein